MKTIADLIPPHLEELNERTIAIILDSISKYLVKRGNPSLFELFEDPKNDLTRFLNKKSRNNIPIYSLFLQFCNTSGAYPPIYDPESAVRLTYNSLFDKACLFYDIPIEIKSMEVKKRIKL